MIHFKETVCLFLFLFMPLMANAQFDDTPSSSQSENAEVEDLYDRYDQQEERRSIPQPSPRKKLAPDKIGTLSELATLEPFNDIAVIQRKFLPKTQRFEIAGMAMGSVNNPFFSNLGFGIRGSYFFTEKHAIELQYYFLSNSERDVTANLRDKRNVETKSLTTPKSYMGAAYKWNPIYGKFTWLNQTIVPFDLFFTIGAGTTKTDLGNQEPTIHIGSGQVYAISKAMAFRWDISWNFYQADAEQSDGTKITNNQDDLFLMVGMSFYFPEAKYR
ncbi:MAG: outer membrane beta-barrel domain-containing protein [Bdellovibrionales bacterium]|nr:outer membrane beta-barrel domain-containing protein [Bdellovibrionales bacterium]